MKYIPGSALLEIGKPLENQNKNVYHIEIECDANDGDYMNTSFDIQPEWLDEVTILLMDYLGRYTGKWYDGWNGGHYGHHLCENKYDKDGLIYKWARNNNFLLYAGMCDGPCHSICSIDVTYFDNDGVEHDVEVPNVDELFDSEEEFVNYIYELLNKDENNE